jgi:hypothetical protein
MFSVNVWCFVGDCDRVRAATILVQVLTLRVPLWFDFRLRSIILPACSSARIFFSDDGVPGALLRYCDRRRTTLITTHIDIHANDLNDIDFTPIDASACACSAAIDYGAGDRCKHPYRRWRCVIVDCRRSLVRYVSRVLSVFEGG